MLSAIAENPFAKKGGLVLDHAAILSHPISGYADLIYAIFAGYMRSKGKQRWGDKTPAYVRLGDEGRRKSRARLAAHDIVGAQDRQRAR